MELKEKIAILADAAKYDAHRALSGVKRKAQLGVYYSAFSPIPDSNQNLPLQRSPMIREHHLYQTDWLLSFYGFKVNKVLPVDVSELDLRLDPKLSWAIRNHVNLPIDLNVALRDILLRIPGLGVLNVDNILVTIKFQKIRLTDLSKMRVHYDKIRPFVVTQDYNPPVTQLDSLHFANFYRPETHVQLDIFSSLPLSVTGEFKFYEIIRLSMNTIINSKTA
jgi:predicted DNA-binding helix-hairpin-helix protein